MHNEVKDQGALVENKEMLFTAAQHFIGLKLIFILQKAPRVSSEPFLISMATIPEEDFNFRTYPH